MKHVFLFICLAVCIGSSAFAQHTKSNKIETKVIKLEKNVNSLTVENGINIVLTDAASTELVVEGDSRDVEWVRTTTAGGNLLITYASDYAGPELKVYVPVKQLNNINLYGNTILSANKVLQNAMLKIMLGGEAKINLRSVGKVIVEPTSDFLFVSGK